MSKHAGVHKAEKRRKELKRLKKQEEKRKKRLLKSSDKAGDAEMAVLEEAEAAPGQESET